ATLDFWDDNVDVYRVHLNKGQRVYARLTPKGNAHVQLALWAPGTQRLETLKAQPSLARSRRVARQARLTYRARSAGIYYLEAKLVVATRDPVSYRLAVSRRST